MVDEENQVPCCPLITHKYIHKFTRARTHTHSSLTKMSKYKHKKSAQPEVSVWDLQLEEEDQLW